MLFVRYSTVLPLKRFWRHSVPVLQNTQHTHNDFIYAANGFTDVDHYVHSAFIPDWRVKSSSSNFLHPGYLPFVIQFWRVVSILMCFWLWLRADTPQGCSWFILTNICVIFYHVYNSHWTLITQYIFLNFQFELCPVKHYVILAHTEVCLHCYLYT